MGNYRYVKNEGWGHTNDIAHNFKAIDFYDDFTVIDNKIYAETVVSMKTTTTTTDVGKWLISNTIKKNLDNLEDGLLTSQGISWNGKAILYNKAEVHIFMPKEKITYGLKAKWLSKLKIERPEIEFKINALEDFIE